MSTGLSRGHQVDLARGEHVADRAGAGRSVGAGARAGRLVSSSRDRGTVREPPPKQRDACMLLILIVDWCCLFSICGWRRHCRARIRCGNVYVNRVHNQLWSTVNANSGHTHRNHSHETCLARLQYATPTPSRPFSPPNSVLLKCASLHLSHSPVSSLSKHTFRQRPSSSCTLPHPLSEASSVNIRRTRSFVAAPVPWCSRHTPPAPRLRSSPPPVLTFIPQPLP